MYFIKISYLNILLFLLYLNISIIESIRDVVVIGGGISGLYCAKILADNGLDVIVVEARDRVGGRTYTINNPNVGYADLGGSYVAPQQTNIQNLIKEFGLQTYKVYDQTDSVYLYNGKSSRFSSGKNPPLGNNLAQVELSYILRRIDQMGDEIPMDAPWNAPHAQEWDQMTYKEFLDKSAWTQTAKDYARSLSGVVTADAYEISLLWFLWYIKQCGGTAVIFGTSGGAQDSKIVNGTQQISERLADIVGRDRVLLNKPVVSIRQTNNTVIVRTLDGTEYESQFLIMSLAPPLQQKIDYSPPLPPLRNQLIQRNPMGSVIKSIVYYKTAFWRIQGFSGSLQAVNTVYLDKDPVGVTYDDTKPDGSHPAIIGFIFGSKSRRIQQLTEDQRLQIIVKEYAKAFINNEALNPIHYVELNWNSEEYTSGSYSTISPPGFITSFGPILRQPIGRMHFAGSETSSNWAGYMEGAIQGGERVARELLVTMQVIYQDDIKKFRRISKIL